jgi:hypothetical protein
MNDHGWKAMPARIRRWLASPVRVEFNPRGWGFGRRSISVAPLTEDEPAPPRRREPIRFRAPVSQAAAERLMARETEYDRLQSEISRLTQRTDDAPAADS